MSPKKWSYGQAGSISEGTMRNQDLIPDFIWELRHLGHKSQELNRIEKKINNLVSPDDESSDIDNNLYWDSEESSYDLESLFNMLNEHCLPYFYFGSHPGDGSDFGFWLSESFEYDFEGLKLDDNSDIPTGYTGDVLIINDHGNMTLYNVKHGHKSEIWALV